MNTPKKKRGPARCAECPSTSFRLTDGREIYFNRPDLHKKPIWICEGCGAYCGCHPGTETPLGYPAGPRLRAARIKLHNERVDPIWRAVPKLGIYSIETDEQRAKILSAARRRTYRYLGFLLGLSVAENHVGMFTLEQCRAAWRVLHGVDYHVVRNWWHETAPIREAAKAERVARQAKDAEARRERKELRQQSSK